MSFCDRTRHCAPKTSSTPGRMRVRIARKSKTRSARTKTPEPVARFYSNENFPLLTVVKLRELGHEVATALEAGNANQRVADEAVLAYAISGNRAVLTINRKHFIALHHRVAAHCGIVVCSLDADFAGQASRIHEAVSLHADLAGMLIRVNRPDRGVGEES